MAAKSPPASRGLLERVKAHKPLLVVGYTPPDNAASHLLAYKATASLALGSGLFRPLRKRLDVSVVSTLRRASKWLPHLDRQSTDSPGYFTPLSSRHNISFWPSSSIASQWWRMCLSWHECS
jgi:hypothetical protein